ncbi:MAG TPA: CHRD domain-containing protein [Gemmatimonadales bacterium]
MKHSDILAVALASLTLACGDDDENPAEAGTEFSATLSGAEEVPPVPTTATGTATFTISGAQIIYTVTTTGVVNPVVAHIHVAPEGENGEVRLNLCGTGPPVPVCGSGTGVLVSGTNGTTLGITFDQLVTAMRAGETYVNVHTDNGSPPPNSGPGDMASGEIRGQIVAEN